MTYRPGLRVKVGNMDAGLGKTTSLFTKLNALPYKIDFQSELSLAGVSVVNGRLRLLAGKSYYIEASSSFFGLNRPANGVFESTLYNVTTSAEIGQRCVCNLGANGLTDGSTRSTRWCARALILASDFGAHSTMDIEFRVVDCSPLDTWYPSVEANPLEGTPQVSVWSVT